MSKIDEVQDTIRNTPGLGKSMAKWGAAGAVAAIVIPFVGPPIGAIAGAVYAYRKRNKV